jgi:hypothetical protein
MKISNSYLCYAQIINHFDSTISQTNQSYDFEWFNTASLYNLGVLNIGNNTQQLSQSIHKTKFIATNQT